MDALARRKGNWLLKTVALNKLRELHWADLDDVDGSISSVMPWLIVLRGSVG